jgi:hypothetical protein
MFTKLLGITLGLILAYAVTKGMNPNFDLHTWATSFLHAKH